MQLKLAFFTLVSILAFNGVSAEEGDVHTVTRVFHTIVKQSPYLVDRTTTVVWTEGPSIADPSATAVPPEVDQTVVYGEGPLPTVYTEADEL
ncbi:hypothetical protein CC1G_02448 [Coprinopsis cinerea okayama7|uniref:Uncharacterized protein n=1 Tax=Coprinopsis cinerea (strain Okayama-7 / 130 / ATCC MYA-4618 / FGSC 9003) TaxID=240176 RepID=A8NBI8_COPC7|nr:hypothetical protein CC1G_02448 [Coprinopsis cinerea okayama7\|eukprot:XP_001832186.1 hypothetical protein CC1G_02448 [Coprinopsis cinerea okayama7\